MSCLVIGDPHFQVNNVIQSIELTNKIVALTKKAKFDFVVILGDILHSHEKLHIEPFNTAVKFITSISEQAPVYVLIGNHDYCLGENIPVRKYPGINTVLSQDVKVGDFLIGDNGQRRIVTHVVSGISTIYTVTHTDSDLSYTASKNHKLCLKFKISKLNIGDYHRVFHVQDGAIAVKYFDRESNADKFIQSFESEYQDISMTVAEFLNLDFHLQQEMYGYTSHFVIGTGRWAHTVSKIKIDRPRTGKYYGWEVNGNNKFLLGNGIVTHNCNNQQFLTDKHGFNALKRVPNVTICDKIIVRKIKGHKFVFCPYVPAGRFEEALNTIENDGKRWDDADCIFAHQEFYGCYYNPSVRSTEGDKWPENYPLVVSGHIHTTDQLQKNIYYPGSCMQHGWNDTMKTVSIINFTNSEFAIQKVDLELICRKKICIEISQLYSFIPPKNTIIKLEITGSLEQIKMYKRSEHYRDFQSRGIIFSFKPKYGHGDENGVINIPKKGASVLEIMEKLISNDGEMVKEIFTNVFTK